MNIEKQAVLGALGMSGKRRAIFRARELRAQGKNVKVFRRSGVYTQPGRGIVPFVSYEVKEV